MVRRPFGESAINPGPVERLTVDRERVSVKDEPGAAFTILRAGLNEPATVEGLSGLETNAREASLLGRVEAEVEELLPQEIKAMPATARPTMPKMVLFKPGTPKSMRDKDLDAKSGIITEPCGQIFDGSTWEPR
jgi:hypothetical protein